MAYPTTPNLGLPLVPNGDTAWGQAMRDAMSLLDGAVSTAQGTGNTALTNAATAQTAANNAQTSANTANAALTSIASDSILSPGEKPAVVLDYSAITTEQAGIDAQADAYTVSRTAYDAAVTALTSYLGTIPGWNTIPGTDVAIVGTTFRQKFGDVYSTRQALLNAIYAKAKALADAAQGTGNTALANAATAQTAANNAQTSANTANADLANIASDAKITAGEKPAIFKDWKAIYDEKSGIDSQATAYAITTEKTAYDNAWTALQTYLNAAPISIENPPTTGSAWCSSATVITIVGTTFRSNFATLYSTRQALLNAIYAKAKALADAAQGTASLGSMAKPLDLWSIGGQTIASVTDGPEGAAVLRLAVSGGYPNAGTYFPVDTTKKYKTRFWARAVGADGILYFSLRQWQDAGTTACAINDGRSPYSPSGASPHPGWMVYEHTWGATDFQSGVKFVLPEFLNNYGGTTGYWEIQAFKFYEVTEVDTAQTGVNTINDPDTLTTGEKPAIIQEYNVLTGENADLVAKANTYGVSHTAYDAAYTALVTTYLPTLTSPVLWSNLTGTTSLGTGNRAALWNPKWVALRSAANDLKAAIASGVYASAVGAAATDALNKANAAQLASQPHQVAWAYASKPSLPSGSYPAGYYAITTDARTVQVDAAGTAWTDVLVAATGLFGQLFSNQLSVANFDNLIPNANSTITSAPSGSFEAESILNVSGPLGTTTPIGSGTYPNQYCRWMSWLAGAEVYKIFARFPVNAGEKFYAEVKAGMVYVLADGAVQLYLRFYRPDGVNTGEFGSNACSTWWDSTTPGVLSVSATAPELSTYCEVWVWKQAGGSNNNAVIFNNFYARRMNDASIIVDGAITANKLETDLALVGQVKSSVGTPWVAGNSSAGPQGFRLSGPAFTTTYIGGATDSNCHFELEGTANFGGHKVATVNNRVMTAFNRILNGSFYVDLTGWSTENAYFVWSSNSSTSGGGSAYIYKPTGSTLPRGDRIVQGLACPPPSGSVSLTLSTGFATTGGNAAEGGNIKAYLFDPSTGTETLLATWTYSSAVDAALAWTARSVDLTSYLSAGGDFVLRISATINASNTNDTVSLHVDNVKVIA